MMTMNWGERNIQSHVYAHSMVMNFTACLEGEIPLANNVNNPYLNGSVHTGIHVLI